MKYAITEDNTLFTLHSIEQHPESEECRLAREAGFPSCRPVTAIVSMGSYATMVLNHIAGEPV